MCGNLTQDGNSTENTTNSSSSSGINNFYNNTDTYTGDSFMTVYVNISIYLPPAVFNNVTDLSVGLLFSFYRVATLFPVRTEIDGDREYPAISSPVVGAALALQEPVANLIENIIITLPFSVVST